MSVDDVARCIMSEASVGNEQERIAVSFAGQRNPKYAKNQEPTCEIRQLAANIVNGQIEDPTQGANHWYSPRSMPKAGESTQGFDVVGGLEGPLPGLSTRNYRPKWAMTGERICIPGVREAFFKFYKL